MSKQSEKEREFSSDFQNVSEFRGDFQSDFQNTCQNSRRKFNKFILQGAKKWIQIQVLP